ncbi:MULTISPECIES: lipid II flippase MurJ [Salipiger]|uniref:lipid II flippase MurJ n=1 Tax=Salipiger TaxID=263377 RepID=UPI0009F94586|nr:MULTISPECIES: lipid II flippase MurJ [Salipiger]
MVKYSSSDRQILRGFSFAFVFLLVAKAIGAIKEMALANTYGTGTAVDAYALSFAIANTPITLVAMASNMILIPFFVAQRHKSGREPENGGIIMWVLLLTLIMSSAVFFLLRFGGDLMGLSPDTALAVSVQAPGFAFMVPSGVIATIISARLMASRRQINSLLEAIPSFTLISGLLIFERHLAANSLLAWFTCLGMFGYLGALLLADRSAFQEFRPRRMALELPSSSRLQEIGLILAAQTAFVLGGLFLDQLAAASLPYDQNATLAYANRLLMLITSLGATAVGRAVLPVLAEARLEGKGQEFELTRRWGINLFMAGVVSYGLGYFLAPVGVRILFEHGEFTPQDTKNVSDILRAGLMVLPVYFLSLMLSQSVVVQRRFGLLLISNLAALACKVVIIMFFLEKWGLPLIMYATVAKQTVSLLFMIPALRPSRHERNN